MIYVVKSELFERNAYSWEAILAHRNEGKPSDRNGDNPPFQYQKPSFRVSAGSVGLEGSR